MHFSKRRRGNLLITVLCLCVVVLMIAAFLTAMVGQKTAARVKAVTAGNTSSYIALANLCADAFREDMEGQTVKLVTADIENPDGQFGLEIYDTAIANMQVGLTFTNNADNSWTHPLRNPLDIIEYAGITDTQTVELMETLLDSASVDITVMTPLSIRGGAEGNKEDLADGDSLLIEDILFRIILKKGTTRIVQEYRLSGEKLTARYEPSLVWCAVDGRTAACKLEVQTVSRSKVQ